MLRVAMDLAEFGVWERDELTGRLVLDARSCQLFGLDPSPSVRDLLSVIHPEDRARVESELMALVASDGTHEAVTNFRISRGLERRRLRLKARRWLDENGSARVGGIVLRADDDEPRCTSTSDDESHRVVGLRWTNDVLAHVCHELRQPLGAILGWSELFASRKELSEAQAETAISVIGRNARALSRLVDDLMDVSSIERGKVSLRLSAVDLRSTVEASVESFRCSAVAQDIELVVSISTSLGVIVGDEGRIEQILKNLLSNALKFTPPQGKIEVLGRRVGDQISISVSDTGGGIPPEAVSHVFERYWQDAGIATRSRKGVGLGLAIAQELARLHGGVVRASSAGRGQGATFELILPTGVASRDE